MKAKKYNSPGEKVIARIGDLKNFVNSSDISPEMVEELKTALGINDLDNTDCLPIGTTVGGFDGTMNENVFAVADGSQIAVDLAPGLKDLLPNVESVENLTTALDMSGSIRQIVESNGVVFIGGGEENAVLKKVSKKITLPDLSSLYSSVPGMNAYIKIK